MIHVIKGAITLISTLSQFSQRQKIYNCNSERERNANTATLQSRSEIDIIRLPAYNSTDSRNSSTLAQTWTRWKKVTSVHMLNAAKIQTVQLP